MFGKIALVALALPLVSTTGLAKTITTEPQPQPQSLTAIALTRLANVLEIPLVAQASVDDLVHLQLAVRDTFHGMVDSLATWSMTVAPAVPDLSVLTTEPLENQLSKSSGYGWRSDPMRHDRRFHHGTDMRADYGTPVHVAGTGVVVFAGQQSGYGNVVYVDHGGGIVTRYAHLQHIDTKKTAAVAAGATIGRVGASGRATGPHLHFEIRLDGRDVDPITAMSVADMQRISPLAGRLAAYALDPAIQKAVVSTEDAKHGDSPKSVAKAKPATSTAKPVRTKRTQVLW